VKALNFALDKVRLSHLTYCVPI